MDTQQYTEQFSRTFEVMDKKQLSKPESLPGFDDTPFALNRDKTGYVAILGDIPRMGVTANYVIVDKYNTTKFVAYPIVASAEHTPAQVAQLQASPPTFLSALVDNEADVAKATADGTGIQLLLGWTGDVTTKKVGSDAKPYWRITFHKSSFGTVDYSLNQSLIASITATQAV